MEIQCSTATFDRGLPMLTILFGTESGNAEMAAEDMAEVINLTGKQTRVISMEDYDPQDLVHEEHVIIMTSTYGEGDLPLTSAPFYSKIEELKLDLSGLKFSAFGLGDSTYEHFNGAIHTFVKLLKDLGAEQVGETGTHDASRLHTVSDIASCWASRLFMVA